MEGPGPVIGRDDLCEVVAAHVRPDERVTDPVLVLLGEAGIGKSMLWASGVEAAQQQGVRVLRAAPAEAEKDLAFAVLGDLLADVLDESLQSLPVPQRHALEVALALEPLDGAAVEQWAVSLAVVGVLSGMIKRGPALLAIDGVQWVDAPSADVMAFALRRLLPKAKEGRLRVLATARIPWELAQPPAWSAHPTRYVRLSGLSVGALQRLVSERLGVHLNHAQMRRVHERARGNPLHALELARSMAEATDRPADDPFVPGLDLTELVLRRLAGLPGSTRELLTMAAAAQQPTLDMLTSALGRPIAGDLAQASAAELVYVDGERVWFRHPLYAAACTRVVPPADLRAVHRLLADVARELEARARHLALATTGPDEVVAEVLDSAAVDARLRGAPGAAAALAGMAASLTPGDHPAGRTSRVIAQARYIAEAGDCANAARLLREHLPEAGPGRDRCRVLLALSRVAYEAEGVLVSRRFAREALDEAQDDPMLAAEALLAYAERSQLPVEQRRDLVNEALALLRAHPEPDPGVLAQALREVALTDYHLGAGMPRHLIDEAISLEEGLRPPPAVAWRASTILGECLKYVDGFTEADALLQESATRAEQEGDLASLAEISGHRAELDLWLGKWDSADALAADAVRYADQTEQDGRMAMARYYHALVAVHRGRTEDARDKLAVAVAAAVRADDEWVQMLANSAAGLLELSAGATVTARDRLAEVDAFATRELLTEPRQWRYLSDYVEALVACGDLDLASERSTRLQQWSDRSGGWAAVFAARASAHVKEVSGDRAAALDELAAALELLETLPLPFARARTLLHHGSLCRRAGQRRAARESLDAASAGFDSLGATLWSDRCRAELTRVGGRPASTQTLTAAEQAVARLVATGASNKEVAATLSISPRTVEVHLGHVFRKLGIRSRGQLAARLP
jgi:DNA-binding CsgD family transcriptional regulator